MNAIFIPRRWEGRCPKGHRLHRIMTAPERDRMYIKTVTPPAGSQVDLSLCPQCGEHWFVADWKQPQLNIKIP